MRVLITGSTGFIGRNVRENLQKDHEVWAPDRRELDLLDEKMVQHYLANNYFDVVIHSANTNNFMYHVEDGEVLDRNLRMFFHLEKNSDKYGKMIYFGSGAEYDMKHYEPLMKEDYFGMHIPKDAYGFSKYIMSKITEKKDNIYDLRLFGVYGKYEEWQRRFISNNLCKLIRGTDMTINQNMKFDYLHINDLCRVVRWFMQGTPKYHHYNVCSGETHTLLEIAELIKKVTGVNRDIQIFQQGMKKEYSGNCQRLFAEMGEWRTTTLEAGIVELYEYYRQHWDLIDVSKL